MADTSGRFWVWFRYGPRMDNAWELAGFYLEGGESLDRPLPADNWQLPNVVELNGDRLVWINDPSLLREGEWFGWRGPSRGMLDGFVGLADARPERVRDYARQWGTLGI